MPIRTNAKLKSATSTPAKKKIEKSRARALPKPPVQSRGIPQRHWARVEVPPLIAPAALERFEDAIIERLFGLNDRRMAASRVEAVLKPSERRPKAKAGGRKKKTG